MTLRWRKWSAPLAVGIVLVAAGGGSQNGGAGIGSAPPPSVEQDCAADGVFGKPNPSLLAYAAQVRPVHLPADAVLVRATRCLYEERDVPGDGSWAFLIEERADSGLDRWPRRCGCRTGTFERAPSSRPLRCTSSR